MTTQTLEPMAHATCAKCPYFQDFGEANGRGWCRVFDLVARSYHQRTSTCEQEIEALQKEIQQPTPEPEAQPQEQPVGEAGDTVSYQLQPTLSASTKLETGRQHGRADAEARLHPMYTQSFYEYTIGYLEGYNSYYSQPQPAPTQPVEWSVTYNSKWQWYEVWVKGRCIGHGSTPEQAERIAQKYIATDEMIQRQNQAVMKAYAG